MRLFTFTLLIFSLLNCKSKTSLNNSEIASGNQIFNLESCEVDTKCSIEVIQNSNLLIKQDNHQNSYIEIEKGDNIIIKYKFNRIAPPNTADANYSELLYFELKPENQQLFLTNTALQNVKMMYSRFCYCKDGTSGIFKVTQGRLKLIRKEKELSIDLNFKVGKIPQLLTEIKETIILE